MCAFSPRRPICIPHRCHVRDPRILNFLDITTTVDASFLPDCLDSGCSSLSGEIFEHCSDDCISPSS